MSIDRDRLVRDTILDALSLDIQRDPEGARRGGMSERMVEVLTHLTPARREFLHSHFHEMFDMAPGVLEEIKQSLWPN